MSKELPYFKFLPTEYLLGEIVFQDYRAQGVFINVCALYWQKECNLTKATLEQRFSDAIKDLKFLLDAKIIQEKDGNIHIKFLDEQWKELKYRHIKAVENGRKGGLKASSSNPQATLKHLDKIRKEEDYKAEFFGEGNEEPLKVVCMQQRLDPQKLGLLFEAFIQHLKTESKTHPSFAEFFRHFRFWIPKIDLTPYRKKQMSNL